MTLSYIQGAEANLAGFVHHLQMYLPLFRELSEFRFLFLARNDAHFAKASELFRDLVTIPLESNPAEDLLRYFAIRKAWDLAPVRVSHRRGADLSQSRQGTFRRHTFRTSLPRLESRTCCRRRDSRRPAWKRQAARCSIRYANSACRLLPPMRQRRKTGEEGKSDTLQVVLLQGLHLVATHAPETQGDA